jgi:hypothetical protein
LVSSACYCAYTVSAEMAKQGRCPEAVSGDRPAAHNQSWVDPADLLRRSRPHGSLTREVRRGDVPATADAEGLRRFLEGEVLPWFEARKKELANRPLIREQAFGESLDPDKLERLGRYEVHLDRKLERTLAMLLRLKDLR